MSRLLPLLLIYSVLVLVVVWGVALVKIWERSTAVAITFLVLTPMIVGAVVIVTAVAVDMFRHPESL
jgi:hypothetical protein